MPGGPLFIQQSATLLGTLFPPTTNWSTLTPADVNCTYGIQWIYRFMGQCVMDERGMAAMICGFICLFAWMLNGIPQIVENFRSGIPDKAMSPYLLMFWTIGDILNFTGCILAHQLILQVVVSIYSIASDLVLVSQFIYYKSRHERIISAVSEVLGDGRVSESGSNTSLLSDSDSQPLDSTSKRTAGRPLTVFLAGATCLTVCTTQVMLEPVKLNHPEIIFDQRSSGSTADHLTNYSSPTNAINSDSVLPEKFSFLPGYGAKIGYSLGCISSLMYISSRLPQIIRNYQRGSTEGLCLGLFCLAVLGNTAYGLQIFLTSLYVPYLLQALPWIMGSLGVLALDFLLCYSNNNRNV